MELNVTFGDSLNGTRNSPLYNGCPLGPTIRVKPGDILKVKLNNFLPPGSDTDHQLYAYTHNEQNEQNDLTNMTIVFDRLNNLGSADLK